MLNRYDANHISHFSTSNYLSSSLASPTNPTNEHLQEVIDAFRTVFIKDKSLCAEKQRLENYAQGFVSPANRKLHGEENKTLDSIEDDGELWNTTTIESNEDGEYQRRLALKWHPFHPDIQKTIHFWGYHGSFTEPPCTDDIVDWKIMDVPTPISTKQLAQLKQLLFNHVDKNCERTSVHNSDGSVARPTQETSKYYKCTRDDYVSDEERGVCGDLGCINPFGEGLNPYYPPIVDVTGPPTRAPST